MAEIVGYSSGMTGEDMVRSMASYNLLGDRPEMPSIHASESSA